MSILIKGMKMPEHCGYCRFAYDGICHALQVMRYDKKTKDGKLIDCPLVEIPTPHGRLIDADALIHELEYSIELEARYLDNFDGTHAERTISEVNKKIFETAIEILQKAPTIIEAEGENVSDD